MSTTSQEDLSLLASDQFSFSAMQNGEDTEEELSTWASDPTYIAPEKGPEYEEEILALLSFPKRWYIHCRYGGCSCHFRHMGGIGLSFGTPESDAYFSAPEDWLSEDDGDVVSTMAVYDALFKMIKEGHHLDLIDYFEGINPKDITMQNVSLRNVPRNTFRFFGGVKFTFSA
jgi:hypothetical protein